MSKLTCRKQLAVNNKKLKTENKKLKANAKENASVIANLKEEHKNNMQRLFNEKANLQVDLDLERIAHTESTQRWKYMLKKAKRWYQIILK